MEPEQLLRGKLFHHRIQTDWAGIIEGARVHPEHGIRLTNQSKTIKHIKRGRIDIFIDQIEDFVTVVEIKSTDWDQVKMSRKKLVGNHCRQILKYVDEYLNIENKNVCAAIVYPKTPDSLTIKEEIERYLNNNFLQVVWYD